MRRTLRLVAVAWLLNVKQLTRSSGLLASEAAVGLTYTVLGYALLRFMEHESRKRASLQIA